MRIFQALWILMLNLIVYYFEEYLCETFLVPKVLSNFKESFVLNDLEYILTNQRITWEEAEIDCSTYEFGSLAIIDNTEKAKFLALALAETNMVVEDLWVGAVAESCPDVCDEQYNGSKKILCVKNKKCYKWFNGDYVIGELMLPRFSEVSIAERYCLTFARNYHQEPSFVDLYCRLQRPYICQRPAEEEDGEMTHRGWIQIGDFEYAIFYAKKTWKESVRECSTKRNAHLADFREMKEVAGIGKYLLTGRPSLENAWIGGHYKNGQWRYISIDDIIPEKKDPITLYPPWAETNETLPQDGCLLLDRHLQDGKKLIFLQARCERKRSYICSRKVSDKGPSPFELIVIDDICYTLFYSLKTWKEAYETCIEANSWLVEVTEEKIDHILYIMGENKTEINHIWIGGKLINNQWYWVYSNDTIGSDSNSIFNGYPPWLEDGFDRIYPCLNMDRENHNKAMFYGVYCNAKQPFICQQYDENCVSKDRTTTDSTSIDTTTPESTTTFDRDPWKWKWPEWYSNYTQVQPFYNWTVTKRTL